MDEFVLRIVDRLTCVAEDGAGGGGGDDVDAINKGQFATSTATGKLWHVSGWFRWKADTLKAALFTVGSTRCSEKLAKASNVSDLLQTESKLDVCGVFGFNDHPVAESPRLMVKSAPPS